MPVDPSTTPLPSAPLSPAPDPAASVDAALAWLYAQRRGGARDPARMRALLAALELAPPPAVWVAGSNGKGSVTAMIAAGLRAAGVRAGRFVSPHVESFAERIEIDGRPVDAAAITAFVARARALAADPRFAPRIEGAGFFEWTLALALERFGGLELAVVEAGVGARRDATAALPAVRLSVLTNVGLDHQRALGATVAEIAVDKSAVARPGAPLVTAARGEALAVVRAAAARVGAPLHALHAPAGAAGRALFALPPGAPDARGRAPAWPENARLAAAALRLLGAPEAAVAAGLTAPALPARFEVFALAGRRAILDGAHDPAAAARLRGGLEPGYALLFGALERKQGAATLAELARGAAAVVRTEAAPGEAPPAWPGSPAFADPAEALGAALAATPAGGTLLVAGSLYLAGRVRPLLRARAGP